ncbi:Hypothetical protein glysoja_048241 [Glycine soja]|uniref:DUF8039 domain-containing protein n=1 Tax=Glycine soja TaxID=3848 RepID=A0A0B2R255_GLYSO|nr:Hypothetical protein glysoja_048241 [Glycine soja]
MGLYVHREDSTELVGLGKIYDGGPAIHNLAYADDVVRVSVYKVINGDAEVPLPSSKIKYVRQALGPFIAWPTLLVKLVSDEVSTISPNKVTEVVDDPLRDLIKSLVDIYEKHVQLLWNLFYSYGPCLWKGVHLKNTNDAEILECSVSCVESSWASVVLSSVRPLKKKSFHSLDSDNCYICFSWMKCSCTCIVGVDTHSVSNALQASFVDQTTKSQDFQGIMNQLYDVMYEFNFSLPPDYALVIRALGSLEGTAKALDPDFKVI